MNLGIVIGRLTRSPEMRFTAAGKAMCRFDVAIGEKYKNQAGEWVENTTYIPVVVWGKQGESCERYLDKGKQVAVHGKMSIRNYEDKEGKKRKSFELIAERVEFLGSKNENSGDIYQKESLIVNKVADQFGGRIEEVDDENIPF